MDLWRIYCVFLGMMTSRYYLQTMVLSRASWKTCATWTILKSFAKHILHKILRNFLHSEMNRQANALGTCYHEFFKRNKVPFLQQVSLSELFDDESTQFLKTPLKWLHDNEASKEPDMQSVWRIFQDYHTKFDSRGYERCWSAFWTDIDIRRGATVLPDCPRLLIVNNGDTLKSLRNKLTHSLQ